MKNTQKSHIKNALKINEKSTIKNTSKNDFVYNYIDQIFRSILKNLKILKILKNSEKNSHHSESAPFQSNPETRNIK
jgi:hypothetical protein